jgi:hypothetical protein
LSLNSAHIIPHNTNFVKTAKIDFIHEFLRPQFLLFYQAIIAIKIRGEAVGKNQRKPGKTAADYGAFQAGNHRRICQCPPGGHRGRAQTASACGEDSRRDGSAFSVVTVVVTVAFGVILW